MSRVPDRVLRPAAWAVPVLLVAAIALAQVLSLSDRARGGRHVGVSLFIVTFTGAGLVILRRQPRNTIGWLLQAIGLAWGLTLLADSYLRYGLLLRPGELPGPDVVAALTEGLWVPGVGLMGTFLLLLFPDGHLPSPRWRAVAVASALTMLSLTSVVVLEPGPLENAPVADLDNPLAIGSSGPVIAQLLAFLLTALAGCVILSAASIVGRFRHATGAERLQLRWFASAAVLIAALVLLSAISSLIALATGAFSDADAWTIRVVDALETLAVWSFVLLPVSVVVAVLRYRLYAIDLVINRALVYGSLTALLGGFYLGSVLLLQVVLQPVTARSDLAVAASTLAVAAAFRPARARVQGWVDRRFFRRRYDAAQTLDDFASRLRHEVDTDAVSADLTSVVRGTVAPAHVSLWIRP